MLNDMNNPQNKQEKIELLSDVNEVVKSLDDRKWHRWSLIIWRFCLTSTLQGHGAPLADKCTSIDNKRRSYKGRAILLQPWKRNGYGESLPQIALVIGWRRKIKVV